MNKFLDRHLFIEAILGSALLCTIAFLFQHTFGFGSADEGLLWYASQRTYHGEMAIRDFFAYDPARYYWNSLFFHLLSDTGLSSLLIAAASFGALGLSISWYTMGIAKVDIRWRIVIGVLITVALGYPRHKVYEQSLSLILASMVFIILISPSSLKKWFIFGSVTGIAAIFGRNHGVFFLVAATSCGLYLLVTRQIKNPFRVTGAYSLGVIVGYSPIIFLFSFDPGFREPFWQSVLSASSWQLPLPIPFFWKLDYSSAFGFNFLSAFSIGLMCVVVPAIYLLGIFCLLFRASSTAEQNPNAHLLFGAASIAGLPYLHQAFDRADFGHIAQATLPVFIAIAGMTAINFKGRSKFLIQGGLFLTLATLLVAWIPSQPAIRLIQMEASNPGTTENFMIGADTFILEKSQTSILREVKRIADKCNIRDGEFLALPYFPGLYAFLGLKAPFWEMYYLYPRPAEFQQRHIKAISSVRLILMSPELAMDGLEKLKLKNIYGTLLTHIETHYKKLTPDDFPAGMFLYVDPKSCDAGN
ncbi:hypothetical protein [Pseudomonas frederiksbergensis]|uniref:hypothetical protein n=1 Tax=Pseudomonas frederiksbergensis TaxID=104087 RepID=UPI003D1C800B